MAEFGRPLVVRVAALGDTILATAMTRSLSELWQRPCDVVVKACWADSVLTGLDSVGEVVGLTSRNTPFWLCPSQQRLVRWLRRRGPGPTYVIDKREAMLHILRRGGVLNENLVTSFEEPWRQRQHHVDHLLEVARVRRAGWPDPPGAFPHPPVAPELAVSGDETKACRQWLGTLGWHTEPLVAVQTQSRLRSSARWPEGRWVSTIGRILDRLGQGMVVLIGARHEARAVQRIADRCRGLKVVNVAGDLPLRRVFALLGLCHSCLSLDTGPAHAAAAVGCPLVVLVCGTHPDEYRPVGPPDRIAQVCALPREQWPDTQQEFSLAHRVSEIEPEQVTDAWARVTKHLGTAPRCPSDETR